MASPDNVDVQPYVRPPRVSAWKAVVLCLRLLIAAPPDLMGRTRAALEAVREACIALQGIARQRLRSSPENLKKYDVALDSGWVGLRMALEAVARLIGTPESDRAIVLLPRALPRGTGFVQLAYEQQWTESEDLLAGIDSEALEPEIEALIGPAFVPYIRGAHAAYGKALGLSSAPKEIAETTALADAVAQVSFAIAEYGRLMVGELDRNDPENVARFKKAMAPLDAYRAANARSGASEEDVDAPVDPATDVDPNGPVPPVPGEPTEA
jgi:hypothetical protein